MVWMIHIEKFLYNLSLFYNRGEDMKICVWGRQTGKTTRALQEFVNTPDCIFFTINNHTVGRLREILKRWGHPELCKFVFSCRSKSWIGTNKKKAIIDEAGLVEPHILGNIERLFDIVSIYTTPCSSTAWLIDKIYDYKNEYHRMPSTRSPLLKQENLDDVKKTLGWDRYQQQYLAKPEQMDGKEWYEFWQWLMSNLPDAIKSDWFAQMRYKWMKCEA